MRKIHLRQMEGNGKSFISPCTAVTYSNTGILRESLSCLFLFFWGGYYCRPLFCAFEQTTPWGFCLCKFCYLSGFGKLLVRTSFHHLLEIKERGNKRGRDNFSSAIKRGHHLAAAACFCCWLHFCLFQLSHDCPPNSGELASTFDFREVLFLTTKNERNALESVSTLRLRPLRG